MTATDFPQSGDNFRTLGRVGTQGRISALDTFKKKAGDRIALLADAKLIEAYQLARQLHAGFKGDERATALLPMVALGDEIESRFGTAFLDALMDAVDDGRELPALP